MFLRSRSIIKRRKGAAALAAALTTVCITSASLMPQASAAEPTSATINVDTDVTSGDLTKASLALSFEKYAINTPTFSDSLTKHLKLLGPGNLRIGANGQDKTFWTSSNETPPDWSVSTITPTSLERLAKVSHDSGWSVVLGVNLKRPDPARVTDEVKHARRILGASLAGIAIGNEPEQYGISGEQYVTNFNSLVAAVRAADSQVPIIGGDVQKGGEVQNALIADQQQQRDISLWTRHYYPTNACSGNKTSIAQLLSPGTLNYAGTAAAGYVAQADSLGVPVSISETNTVACSGQAGVSDVFASALWSLATTMLVSQVGVDNIAFHGSTGRCGGTAMGDNFYTPFCAAGEADYNAGKLTAQPEFYGLMAIRQAGNGKFAAVENPVSDHLRTYAVKDGNKLNLVLVNVDNKDQYGPINVKLNLDRPFASGKSAELATTSPEGLAAKDGITLAGDSLADAQFTPVYKPVTVSGNTVDVTIEPGSAQIIKLS